MDGIVTHEVEDTVAAPRENELGIVDAVAAYIRQKRLAQYGILILLLVFQYFFYSNRSFQTDSESLALSNIVAARDGLSLEGRQYGLFFIYPDDNMGPTAADNNRNSFSFYMNENHEVYNYKTREYHSQVGLQGWVWYFSAKILKPFVGNRLLYHHIFRLICCFMAAGVFFLICKEINRKYNKLLAICFYVTFLFSPWIINFARNLYWVEFTWFIPMLLGLVFLNNFKNRKVMLFRNFGFQITTALYPLFFIAIFVKCLCGYEYITVIMMSSIMFLVAECFVTEREQRVFLIKSILTIGIISVLGFIAALLIHSYIRGNSNIMEGLSLIYKQDVLRRTLGGSPSEFPDAYKASLQASILSVMIRYIFLFPVPVFLFTTFIPFFVFLFLPIPILVFNRKSNIGNFVLPLYIISFLTCTSWFILGKSHSFIHIHMNYVLWYFGFVQISLYIILKAIRRGYIWDIITRALFLQR
jgi:hypothetical protein